MRLAQKLLMIQCQEHLLAVAQCLKLIGVSQEHLLVVKIIQMFLLLLPQGMESATQLHQVTDTLLDLSENTSTMSMSMSKTFTGGAVCREFESEAPAAEEMLD